MLRSDGLRTAIVASIGRAFCDPQHIARGITAGALNMRLALGLRDRDLRQDFLAVRAAMADSSGMGDAAWRAKWWTRKYAPLTPISSAATDSSTACLSMSEAVWPEPGPP